MHGIIFHCFIPLKHCLVFRGLFLSFRVNILKISFKRKKFFIQQRQKHVSNHLTFFVQVVTFSFLP